MNLDNKQESSSLNTSDKLIGTDAIPTSTTIKNRRNRNIPPKYLYSTGTIVDIYHTSLGDFSSKSKIAKAIGCTGSSFIRYVKLSNGDIEKAIELGKALAEKQNSATWEVEQRNEHTQHPNITQVKRGMLLDHPSAMNIESVKDSTGVTGLVRYGVKNKRYEGTITHELQSIGVNYSLHSDLRRHYKWYNDMPKQMRITYLKCFKAFIGLPECMELTSLHSIFYGGKLYRSYTDFFDAFEIDSVIFYSNKLEYSKLCGASTGNSIDLFSVLRYWYYNKTGVYSSCRSQLSKFTPDKEGIDISFEWRVYNLLNGKGSETYTQEDSPMAEDSMMTEDQSTTKEDSPVAEKDPRITEYSPTAEEDSPTAEKDSTTPEEDSPTAEKDSTTPEEDSPTSEEDSPTSEEDSPTSELPPLPKTIDPSLYTITELAELMGVELIPARRISVRCERDRIRFVRNLEIYRRNKSLFPEAFTRGGYYPGTNSVAKLIASDGVTLRQETSRISDVVPNLLVAMGNIVGHDLSEEDIQDLKRANGWDNINATIEPLPQRQNIDKPTHIKFINDPEPAPIMSEYDLRWTESDANLSTAVSKLYKKYKALSIREKRAVIREFRASIGATADMKMKTVSGVIYKGEHFRTRGKFLQHYRVSGSYTAIYREYSKQLGEHPAKFIDTFDVLHYWSTAHRLIESASFKSNALYGDNIHGIDVRVSLENFLTKKGLSD